MNSASGAVSLIPSQTPKTLILTENKRLVAPPERQKALRVVAVFVRVGAVPRQCELQVGDLDIDAASDAEVDCCRKLLPLHLFRGEQEPLPLDPHHFVAEQAEVGEAAEDLHGAEKFMEAFRREPDEQTAGRSALYRSSCWTSAATDALSFRGSIASHRIASHRIASQSETKLVTSSTPSRPMSSGTNFTCSEADRTSRSMTFWNASSSSLRANASVFKIE
jgi:hypothetical protein